MPVFMPGTRVETQEPLILVDIDPERPYPPGRMRFQLVVTDDSGNTSVPAELVVQVLDTQAPNAVLDGPSQVQFGSEFELSGRRSVDLGGGQIVSYVWSRVE